MFDRLNLYIQVYDPLRLLELYMYDEQVYIIEIQ